MTSPEATSDSWVAKSSTRWRTSGSSGTSANSRRNHWWHTVPGGLVTHAWPARSAPASGAVEPCERMRPIHDDVADVGVQVALGQGRWQRGRQPVGVVDEGKVGCTGIDAVQGLVGVLLGDVHA